MKNVKDKTIVGNFLIIVFGVGMLVFVIYSFSLPYIMFKYGKRIKGKVIEERIYTQHGNSFKFEYQLGENMYTSYSDYDCEASISKTSECTVICIESMPVLPAIAVEYNSDFSDCK